MHRAFNPRRLDLLETRRARQHRLDAGEWPTFLPETSNVRETEWTVPPAPRDLQRRHVEITGPPDRKMMIHALNSGADCYMADFEDSLSPTWDNVVEGQANLIDAVAGRLVYEAPDGRRLEVGENPATLLVRPRGWHLHERNVLVGGAPVSASLFDAGIYLFHNAKRLLDTGSGPYFYLPKLESHEEARLWHDVFVHAERALDLPRGSIRATVLIETVLAAFEMDEILHELGEHATALNAGRWDYLFSIIKKLRAHPDAVLPDRAELTMTTPFMRAYAQLLVETCHRRGAHAMGGMAAFIPNRRKPDVTERALAKVRQDKEREVADGFDGTWVAHPDLVPVAREIFDRTLGENDHQLSVRGRAAPVTERALLDVRVPGARITREGLATNVEVAISYIEAWLRGQGAVAIHDLMEDAATAEISRSQVWQWLHHGARLDTGEPVTRDLVRAQLDATMAALREAAGPEAYARGRYGDARDVFERVALASDFPEFLTLPAYEHIR